MRALDVLRAAGLAAASATMAVAHPARAEALTLDDYFAAALQRSEVVAMLTAGALIALVVGVAFALR